jgi:hypothetical protein
MSNFTLEHMEKDLPRGGKACLTGKVITVYDAQSAVQARRLYPDEDKAREIFMRLFG